MVRIYGFPPQEDFPNTMRYPPPTFGTDGPYIHYLFGESPASVKYVMGDHWRSQLQSDPRGPPEGDAVLHRTDEELTEEAMMTAGRDDVYYALAEKSKRQEDVGVFVRCWKMLEHDSTHRLETVRRL